MIGMVINFNQPPSINAIVDEIHVSKIDDIIIWSKACLKV